MSSAVNIVVGNVEVDEMSNDDPAAVKVRQIADQDAICRRPKDAPDGVHSSDTVIDNNSIHLFIPSQHLP